jgi:hypothetical protein
VQTASKFLYPAAQPRTKPKKRIRLDYMNPAILYRRQSREPGPEMLGPLLLLGNIGINHRRVDYNLSPTGQQLFGGHLRVLAYRGADSIFAAGQGYELIDESIYRCNTEWFGLNDP